VISDRHTRSIVLSRKNAKPWKDTKAHTLKRKQQLRTIKYLGRTMWKNWSGYHLRSLVETKMHWINLLGDKLSAKYFLSQVNEVHTRIAVSNKFTEIGRPYTPVVS